MAWAPNFWESDLVFWVQVRVQVHLLRVPPRVMRMRLPVRMPSVRLPVRMPVRMSAMAAAVLWLVPLILFDSMCNVEEKSLDSCLYSLEDE